MLRQRIREEAATLGIVIDKEQAKLMSNHWQMVAEANSRFNLTAIRSRQEAAIKHYVDSLLPLAFLPHLGQALDIGSGAGYPGVPLAIMRPELQWTLLDSSQKRCAFLQQVATQLDLSQINILCARAEKAAHEPLLRQSFSVVVARAVSPLPVLLEYALPFLIKGGLFLAMKGPGLQEELTRSQNALQLLGGHLQEVHRYILPGEGGERHIALIRKEADCSEKYPRREGKPEKAPL
jgi:16S rRNA (guanine527-N7)-methyltransferase